MDALIKIKVSELNTAFLEKLRALFKGNDDAELTISFNEYSRNYMETLNRSKADLEQRNGLVSFTIDELEAFSNKKSA
ncbi:hypothetical protein GCM10023093_27540 [Nemorincola caseinilytica]|uniref:Uncharacterized protein n=1 Tax=Nemorincola caseinilytica TaxID=2054315 RepID=A0ABP8NPM9_9BACT